MEVITVILLFHTIYWHNLSFFCYILFFSSNIFHIQYLNILSKPLFLTSILYLYSLPLFPTSFLYLYFLPLLKIAVVGVLAVMAGHLENNSLNQKAYHKANAGKVKRKKYILLLFTFFFPLSVCLFIYLSIYLSV